MSHPYQGLPSHRFWWSAMGDPHPGQIDPVTSARRIGPGEKVATIGSCFAQHISRQIQRSGLNYFVAEAAPADMAPDRAAAEGYGVFSARYGNVYTVHQAGQLLERALGRFTPEEDVWRLDSGFVDAFRPGVMERPIAAAEEVRFQAREHLACVRRLFLETDWLVFTLGLTESWRSKVDGAVYPLAPGVAGGAFDPERHEFHNATLAETSSGLRAFIEGLREINPGIKIILTVSPVSMAATFEDRHVLASTVLTKSILRVAADEMERAFPGVFYFPAYEVATSAAAGGRYHEDDLRHINDLGVDHVMRLFRRHFIDGANTYPMTATPIPPSSDASVDLVCDEELLVQAMARGGFADAG